MIQPSSLPVFGQFGTQLCAADIPRLDVNTVLPITIPSGRFDPMVATIKDLPCIWLFCRLLASHRTSDVAAIYGYANTTCEQPFEHASSACHCDRFVQPSICYTSKDSVFSSPVRSPQFKYHARAEEVSVRSSNLESKKR
jgi:hypothetical protein